MNVLSKAIKEFNSGRYDVALPLFRKAAEIYGENVVSFQINKCLEKLSKVTINSDRSQDYLNINSENNIGAESILNTYFDKVYVVNLDFHIEKKLKICNHLNKHGVSYKIFKATNGYKEPIKSQFDNYVMKPLGKLTRYPEWNEREIKRGKHYIESAGAMGYIYTYINILKDAQKNKYKKILILEDDILLSQNFEADFTTFLKKISDDWKVLQLGASQYNWGSVELDKAILKGYYFPRQIDTCGSFAIAFDTSIVDELIEELSFFEAPFDHLPLGTIYEKYIGKCFVCYPNIIMPDVGVSYIRGERNQYEHAKKMKWEMSNFNYPLTKLKIGLIIHDPNQLKYFPCFSKENKAMFELKLFYLSDNGIRPIHNIEYTLKNSKEFITEKPKSIYSDLGVDILGWVKSKISLCERDILDFAEFCLNISTRNHGIIDNLDKVYIPHNQKGKVSIIIPTYKRKEILYDAVKSVITQDYVNKEIIVVDDNYEQEYSDHVLNIINNLKSEYPSIELKYIKHTKNRNGSAARNTGIFHSSGEYVCFLDDDDLYLPGRLSKSIEKLATSDMGAVYCGFLGWNSPENNLKRYPEGNLMLSLLSLDKISNYVHTNTVTYKKSALLSLNGFDESYYRHQDLELNVRFFTKFSMCSLPEALVKLKPKPKLALEHSNMVSDLKIYDLKLKFLAEFEDIIKKYDISIVDDIYRKHWQEAFKHISQEIISEKLMKDVTNPLTHIIGKY